MKQYIDKADIVKEIERRIEENKAEIQRATDKHLEEYFEGYEDALFLFKEKFLDTLEVKENDLVEELDYDDYMAFLKSIQNIVTVIGDLKKHGHLVNIVIHLALKHRKENNYGKIKKD